MKITLLSDESIRLEPATGQLTIEAESGDQEYSPYQMLASGLAMCTFGVLQSWASHAGVSADDLVIDVSWSFAEKPHRVVGFGLGFSMNIDPARYGVVASQGDFGWGGAESTEFYVDPVEVGNVSFYTQLLPSSTLPIRNYLRALVNQALVD